eukprot:2001966-Heterocapsa_arctica.AAC.1
MGMMGKGGPMGGKMDDIPGQMGGMDPMMQMKEFDGKKLKAKSKTKEGMGIEDKGEKMKRKSKIKEGLDI